MFLLGNTQGLLRADQTRPAAFLQHKMSLILDLQHLDRAQAQVSVAC
jgi:hypothetical protein